jgi:hypothetical protein
MIKWFNNIKPISGIFLIILGAIIYTTIYICHYLGLLGCSLNPWLYLLGFISIIAQCLVFNSLCVRFDIVYKHTYIPAYFYLITSLISFSYLSVNSLHIYSWLFLGTLYHIVSLPVANFPRRNLYFAAIFTGCASFVIPFYAVAFILLIFATIIFKNLNLLDFLALATGIFLPLAFVYFINFAFNTNLPNYLIHSIHMPSINVFSPKHLWLSYLLIAMALGFFFTFINYFKNNIQTRRMLRFVVYIFIIHLIIVLANFAHFFQYVNLLIVPAAIAFTYLHLGGKYQRSKNFSNFLILGSILIHLVLQIL